MIEELVMLASYGSFGGNAIGEFLQKWQAAGFFDYLLPFLLIFALVYAILSKVTVFEENRAINGIISVSVGLMSLQFDLVPRFFSEIFPRTAVGLAVILILIILLGMFTDTRKGWLMYTFLGIGAVILIIVLVQTGDNLGWASGGWWYDNWEVVAGVVVILALVGVVVGSANPASEAYKSRHWHDSDSGGKAPAPEKAKG